MSEDRILIKRSEIDAMEGVAKTHFLNANAVRTNKSLGDLTGLTGLGFHIIDVAPGRETTEHHMHHFEDECLYVLSGSATARHGDEELAIEAGDFLGYRAGGLAHSIINTGTEVLRCIVVGQRLAHDVGDYPWKGQRIYRNDGMTWDLVPQDAIVEPGACVGKK
ncbi:MAG: cupin domain-containing protein [Pseudomonadota bacterium]